MTVARCAIYLAYSFSIYSSTCITLGKQHMSMKKEILYSYLIFECINVAVNIHIKDSLLAHTNVRLSTLDLITRDGYIVENHEIQTDDGYIINIQRIAGKPGSIPVLIVHGLCADSHIWVLNGKNHSLPYLLADDGFDVWLGNVRGNSYGKMHVKLSTSELKFWNFSVDEIGTYDLPGMISYIYDLTHKQLVFIGYSMSANAGLIMNVKRHDMDVKIRLMVHLGPPVFMNTARISSNPLVHRFHRIKSLLDSLQVYEWPPGYRFIRYVAKNGCSSNHIRMKICEEILLSSFNYDHVYVDHSTLEMIMNHITDTTSTMVMDHMVQWIKSGHFRPYDHGIIQNIKKYKRIAPPDYNLRNIYIPTAVFYTEYDDYVSSQAIHKLYPLFPNKAGLFKVNSDKFSHLHFGFGRNAHDLVYEKIIKIIRDNFEV